MKILFLSFPAPFPVTTGGSQRTHLLHRALSACGEVSFIAFDSPGNYTAEEWRLLEESYGLLGMAPLSDSGPHGWLGRFHSRTHPRLSQLAYHLDASRSRFMEDRHMISKFKAVLDDIDQFDLIVGRYTRSLTKLGLLNRGIPTLLDIDDLDSTTFESRMTLNSSAISRWVLARHAVNIRRSQQQVFNRINHLWVANPKDLDIIDAKAITVLPNIPFTEHDTSVNTSVVESGCRRIITIGSYRHPANVIGVNWFLRHVWPSVLQRIPEASFAIYGSYLSDAVRGDWQQHAGVEVVGFVDDVANAYADAALAVCSVLTGAGTNIKVIEAAAHKRQCVLTPVAARGFMEEPAMQDVLLVGDTPAAMSKHITTLLQDISLNRQMADDFHCAVSTHYSTERFNQIVASDVASVVAGNEARQ